MRVKYFLYLLLVFFSFVLYAKEKYITIQAKKGETIRKIFNDWEIKCTQINLTKFKVLNHKKLKNNDKIFWGLNYRIPILIYSLAEYSDSISTLLDPEVKQAINDFNKKIFAKGLFTQKDYILIPFELAYIFKNSFDAENEQDQKNLTNKNLKKTEIQDSKSKLFKPYYGKKFPKIKRIDNSLKSCAFYLVSGHGGVDPGAIGKYKGKDLCEDEYAYDITLRLALELQKRGAKIFMITIDTMDGIREGEYLIQNNKECFYGGIEIPLNQKERLQVCSQILNELYEKNKKKYRKNISVNIHLDSRGQSEKIDIFFYYQEQNPESQEIANTLLETLRLQYEKKQPGRGYNGTVSTRNLLMLRNSKPPTVYIELGNIQNPYNQVRFVKSSNRQAIAKWLALGFVRYLKKK